MLGLAIRLAYVLATRHYRLAGDAPEYDIEGLLIAHGHWFYTRLPYGILHAGAWKAPGYPAWVGLWYWLFGHHPDAVRLVQVALGAVTIVLSWLLARRLFGPRVAVAAALLVAVYPSAWQYEGLLYPEALSAPLTVATLIVILTARPGRGAALALGALLGVGFLVRPSGEFLIVAAVVAWSLAAGLRRGVAYTALAVAVAALIVAPWTVRNAVVMHGFVPISMQDAALYGTFNGQAAADPVFPYAWRRDPPSVADLFDARHPLPDVTLRARLIRRGEDYIRAHPASLAKAFFWNGITRLWDIRSRSQSLFEVPFEGRSRLVTNLGLDAYIVVGVLAVIGLWRARRRRALVWGVIALVVAMSVTFTVDGGTRYRAPVEPLLAVLACAGALGAAAAEEPRPSGVATEALEAPA